jgi:hypothetical protein
MAAAASTSPISVAVRPSRAAPPVPVLGSAGAAALVAGRCAEAGATAAFGLAAAADLVAVPAGVAGRGVGVRAALVTEGKAGGDGGAALVRVGAEVAAAAATAALVGAAVTAAAAVGAGLGDGVGVAWATDRFTCTAAPCRLGIEPCGEAGRPLTMKSTFLPGLMQPGSSCTSTVYWPPLTVPTPQATPSTDAVTVEPEAKALPELETPPKKRATVMVEAGVASTCALTA